MTPAWKVILFSSLFHVKPRILGQETSPCETCIEGRVSIYSSNKLLGGVLSSKTIPIWHFITKDVLLTLLKDCKWRWRNPYRELQVVVWVTWCLPLISLWRLIPGDKQCPGPGNCGYYKDNDNTSIWCFEPGAGVYNTKCPTSSTSQR